MTIRTYGNTQPKLGHGVYVDSAATVIGDVELGDDCSVWPGAVLRGDVHSIRIGARSNIQDGSICHVTHDGPFSPGGLALSVGEDVTVGHRVILHACQVGDRCLIGMGAIVMDGAEIEDEVMVGAAALVTAGKRLRTGFLYVGTPAKPLRALTDEERAFLRYSAEHYVRLKNKHAARG